MEGEGVADVWWIESSVCVDELAIRVGVLFALLVFANAVLALLYWCG